jgi:tetratricopeptide (TPR) repeat protein
MMRGVNTLLISTVLIVTGCAAPADKIKIRPVGGSAVQVRPVNEQVAYGRGQLQLGSPALALEAFRKALREQPNNAEALAGIADSYAAIGRNDLARRYYEEALALAPQDPVLLQAVAPPVPSHPVKPSSELATVRGELPADSTPSPLRTEQAQTTLPAPAATVTVKLPQARPVQSAMASSVPPRLERLSPGEVALVTTAKPIWQAAIVSRTRLSTTVRWVPVRSANSQPQIRLLNAARRQGLAADTRRALYTQGWRKLAIGDAPQVRAKSVVLYPAGREALGRNLAAHLGFRGIGVARGDAIVVLLGRDASFARLRQLRG